MYFCDPDSASGATAHCGSTFLAALAETQYIRHKVKTEDYRLETDPITRSAASTRAGTTVGEDWLAVGDAAVSYDPLSAKGIETALRGGEEASKAIVGALRGDKSGLQQYANSLSSQWNTFQTERLRYYDMESRWPERSFWQSRRSPVNPTREISGATDETEPTT
jgi:flavin-dependent dehydrogenase